MGFFAPWFLAALAAVGLPVYIHLLRRHTTTPRPVSSLMFFERGTQSSTRHRRLRYLLLFALRVLLLLLLTLAFANPFLRRSSAAASDRLLMVAIDNSFSMRAGTRLTDAKRNALAVLTTRRPSQRAQVMVLGGELQILTQPIQDSAALQSAVEGIQPGDSHGNFGKLGRGMRALAETVHTPIELHLFSDMQASNLPANFGDMVMPGNVTLVLHPEAKATLPNWTVESVEAPSQLVDPKRTRVLTVIAGHQTPAAARAVSLVVNGVVTATKKVEVPADGRATVAFESLDVPYGASRCQVRIDAADGFPADDTSNFAVKRADPERVLFVHQAGDPRSPLYYGAALAAAGQASFVLQPINVDQAADVDPTKYAFVVLSDVPSIPSILENTLLHDVQSGGSVLIAAGTSEAHRQRIPLFGENVVDSRFYSRTGGFSTVGQMDLSHPAMKDASGWSDAKFYYASIVDPGRARVVARLSDGAPLLLDKQIGQGHVLLFASGFENLTNDLPLHPAFVPFVDHAARYLSGMEGLSGARTVDSFVQLRSATNEAAAQAQGATVEIVAPDGKRPLSLQQEATVQSFQLKNAGFYQMRFASGQDALVAVNSDRRESALDLMPEDVLKLWSGNGGGSDAPVRQTENSAAAAAKKNAYSLWWWFMLFLLVAALAESVVASRYLGTQREEV
jgi:Aerotolerance regulator N-terminal/von Willebrand factor type A domain